ncbi:MAG TPA: hypothetical protein VGA37_12615 [Gemmatimonadales bacterium]
MKIAALLLAAIALAGAAALAGALTVGLDGTVRVGAAVLSSDEPLLRRRPAAGPEAVTDIVARNLFVSTRSAPRRRDPAGVFDREAKPTAASLVLVGITLGSVPAALLRGFPDYPPTRLLAQGESFAGTRLVGVDSTTVMVVVPTGDTVRLVLRRPA